MPATALSKGLSTLGSRLPAAGLETSLALSTPSRQLRPHPAGLLTLPGAPLRCSHARLTPLQLQPRLHWAWAGGVPTTPASACRCSSNDDGGGGGGNGGKGTGSASGVRWRLEEGGTEAHSAVNVVLVSPQIPGNAGSIARTCAAAGVRLHLVEPMAFQLDDAKLKRAGLDYWPYVCVAVHSSWAAFMDYYHTQPGPKRLIGFSKKATTLYTDVKYRESDWLLFGSETQGFPEAAVGVIRREGALVRIPMSERHVRSLNLSVSVGIGLFESLRQLEAQQTRPHSSQHLPDPVPGAAAGQGVTLRTQ